MCCCLDKRKIDKNISQLLRISQFIFIGCYLIFFNFLGVIKYFNDEIAKNIVRIYSHFFHRKMLVMTINLREVDDQSRKSVRNIPEDS